MNILNRYVEKGDETREERAYNLLMLYDYCHLGSNISSDLPDEQIKEFEKKKLEIRDEIAQYIMKGMK